MQKNQQRNRRRDQRRKAREATLNAETAAKKIQSLLAVVNKGISQRAKRLLAEAQKLASKWRWTIKLGTDKSGFPVRSLVT